MLLTAYFDDPGWVVVVWDALLAGGWAAAFELKLSRLGTSICLTTKHTIGKPTADLNHCLSILGVMTIVSNKIQQIRYKLE